MGFQEGLAGSWYTALCQSLERFRGSIGKIRFFGDFSKNSFSGLGSLKSAVQWVWEYQEAAM